jgi:hypothetical protein
MGVGKEVEHGTEDQRDIVCRKESGIVQMEDGLLDHRRYAVALVYPCMYRIVDKMQASWAVRFAISKCGRTVYCTVTGQALNS